MRASTLTAIATCGIAIACAEAPTSRLDTASSEPVYRGTPVWFEPEDLTTNVVGTAPIRLVLDTTATDGEIEAADLNALVSGLSLRSSPSMAPIAANVAVESEETEGGAYTSVVLTPSTVLEPGWYELQGTLPAGFVWSDAARLHRVAGGSTGARLRVGSEPTVASIRLCDFDADDSSTRTSVVVFLSEFIESDSAPTTLLAVSRDGASISCQSEQLPEEYQDALYLDCDKVFQSDEDAVTVAVESGIQGITGVPLAPGAFNFTRASLALGGDDCRIFRP